MQNAGIATLGLDWRYTAAEVRPEQLSEAIAGAQAMHYVGLNLTVPHKLLALDMVEVLDESAHEWGAVNTILFEGQTDSGDWRAIHEFETAPENVRSHGFNTDADGITQSLREDLGMEVRGESILLLGAGGAGRVAALKIAATGVKELFLKPHRQQSRSHRHRDSRSFPSRAGKCGVSARRSRPRAQCHLPRPQGRRPPAL